MITTDNHIYLKPRQSHRIGGTDVFVDVMHEDTTGRPVVVLAWETPPPSPDLERLRRRMNRASIACWIVTAMNVLWIASRVFG